METVDRAVRVVKITQADIIALIRNKSNTFSSFDFVSMSIVEGPGVPAEISLQVIFQKEEVVKPL